jgi:hypothetical protein
MTKKAIIKVEELEVKDNYLVSKLSCSKGIGKYFLSNSFYVEYDKRIDNVDRSILQIPIVSNIVTLAWVIGADIYVKELDETYLKSLHKIRSILSIWYPQLPINTKINVEKIISNKFSNKGYGLLFSGGIDSTASYIRHRSKKPNLITIRGIQPSVSRGEAWKTYRDMLINFSSKEGVNISFIRTNAREFIDERFVNVEFTRRLIHHSWWVFRHAIVELSLCAPLTKAQNIGTLLIASTFTKDFNYPWGSHPLIDNNVSWADVGVVHDGYGFSRQDKVKYLLKNLIDEYENYPFLRICNFSVPPCCKCTKCLQAIIALTLENIDPKKCGFNIDAETFDDIKRVFVKNKLNFDLGTLVVWKDIQNHIPETLEHNLYNSREFFIWFRSLDLSRYQKRRTIQTRFKENLYYIYKYFPKVVQKFIYSLRKSLS